MMTRLGVSKRLWDYLIVWICETYNLSVSSSQYANGRTPIKIITGDTPDISEYLNFGFYDWVLYWANAGLGELSIGRWIGVSHKIGQLMSYWILPVSGKSISTINVQHMTESEKEMEKYKVLMATYDAKIEQQLDVKDKDIDLTQVPHWNHLSYDKNDPNFMEEFGKVIDDEGVPDADAQYGAQPVNERDAYINMEIGLPRGGDDELIYAKVKGRALDSEGDPIGKESLNPITDTRLYEVEFVDGTTETVPANLIAENLLLEVDQEGHR